MPNSRVPTWWREASRWQRVRTSVVLLAAAWAVVYQLLLANWYIEDAAISFTYARSLASGEGLVPWPGGERVEGYSNPSWVLLMAAFELVGVDGFWSSKLLACVFAFATVPLTWAIARDLRTRDDAVPVLAAVLLAANPQFAIWNASGLENALFCFLLALGIHATLREARTGGFALSAAAFLGLAVTRPEGLMYAAAGGAFGLVLQLRARRGLRPTLGWLVAFWTPFLAYHAARYAYFAWPLPNTYYAKVVEEAFDPLRWDYKGWRYVRRYGQELGQGWLAPITLLGVVGTAGWRRWAWAWLTLAMAAFILYPGVDAATQFDWWPAFEPPPWWSAARTTGLAAVAVAAIAAGLGRPGWPAAAMCGTMALAGIFFAIRAGGDWMDGFRWMSLVSVPLSVLLAAGIGELADATQGVFGRRGPWRAPAWIVVALLLVGTATPGAVHFEGFSAKPETGPFSVRRRVQYQHQVVHRLHLDRHTITSLDVDMGGNMFWSGFEMVDAAGLVDVPIGHHLYDRPFILEYVFTERRPELAHSHGGWFRKMKFGSIAEFSDSYFEIPGYPAGSKAFHVGNHVRRDLFSADVWRGTPGRKATFADGITLHGFELPLGDAAPGRSLFVEVALDSRRRTEDEDFRLVATLSRGDRVVSFEIAPGYDWYAPHQWRDGEIVFTRQALALPDDAEPGTWDLGFVVFGPEGVHPATWVEPDGAIDLPPVYAVGEVRFPGVVTVLTPEAHDARVSATRDALATAAAEGRCTDAEGLWEDLRLSRPVNHDWADAVRPGVARQIATCWLGVAQQAPDRAARVDALAAARDWDHWTPGLRAAGRPVADALFAEGMAARDAKDWQTAYERFGDVLRIEATRSWARRYLEEARDFRLGIDPETLAAQEEERRKRIEEAEERRRHVLELRDRDRVVDPPTTPRAIDRRPPGPGTP